MLRILEHYFEKFLWNTRLVVISAVLSTLVAAFAVFYIATIDTWIMVSHLGNYGGLDAEARAILRTNTIEHVVEIIDAYLLATVLLIFSLGLYELFISKIQDAADSETASKVLIINDLDDLKSRLAKVILMILIVIFFENALKMTFTTALDMLYFAGGIALIGLALYFSHASDKKPHTTKPH